MKLLKRHSKKIWLLVDQFIVSGANFLLSIIIAKKLGLDQFSLFASIQLVYMFFSSMHQAFVIAPLLTLIPQKLNKNEKRRTHKTVFIIHLFFIVITVLISLIFSSFSFFEIQDLQEYLVVSMLFIIGYLNYEYVRKLLLIDEKLKFLVVMNIISFITPLVIVKYSSHQFDINEVIFLIALFLIIPAIIIFIFFYRTFFSLNLFKKELIEIWKFSKWLLAKSIVNWFSGNYYIVVAGALLGKNYIGIIRIAQNLFGVFNVLLVVLENYLSVTGTKIFANDGYKSLLRFQQNVIKLILPFIGCMLLAISIFSNDLITIVYGDEYAESHSVLIGFSILYLLIFLNLSDRFVLRTNLKTKSIFLSHVVSTIISFFIAHQLILNFNEWGVVIGLIISQITVYIMNKVSVMKLTKLKTNLV